MTSVVTKTTAIVSDGCDDDDDNDQDKMQMGLKMHE